MTYFADTPTKGRVLSGHLPWTIGIVESPDNATLIGTASEIGRTDDGLSLWRLKVRGTVLQGQFILEDGQFLPADDALG